MGDGYCTVHMPRPCPCPCPPMPMPCCAHAHAPSPRVPAVVVEQARQGELDSGDDPWQGSRWASTAPSQPILVAWSGSLIKLNIGIDLDNLTTCPALSCPSPQCAYGGTGRPCGQLPHRRTGSRAGGLQVVGHSYGPRPAPV